MITGAGVGGLARRQAPWCISPMIDWLIDTICPQWDGCDGLHKAPTNFLTRGQTDGNHTWIIVTTASSDDKDLCLVCICNNWCLTTGWDDTSQCTRTKACNIYTSCYLTPLLPTSWFTRNRMLMDLSPKYHCSQIASEVLTQTEDWCQVGASWGQHPWGPPDKTIMQTVVSTPHNWT